MNNIFDIKYSVSFQSFIVKSFLFFNSYKLKKILKLLSEIPLYWIIVSLILLLLWISLTEQGKFNINYLYSNYHQSFQ